MSSNMSDAQVNESNDNLCNRAIKEIIEYRVYSEDELLIDAIVCQISPKLASKAMLVLSMFLPLHKYGLSHLKRIRKDEIENKLEIILCPEANRIDLEIFRQQVISPTENISIEPLEIKDIFTTTMPMYNMLVPRYSPNFKAELDRWVIHWPIHFRPSLLEREKEKGLGDEEIETVREFMSLVDDDARKILEISGVNDGGALIVNPNIMKVCLILNLF